MQEWVRLSLFGADLGKHLLWETGKLDFFWDIIWLFFFFHLVIWSKVAIDAKGYRFQIPGTKHVDMFSQIYSQPAN